MRGTCQGRISRGLEFELEALRVKFFEAYVTGDGDEQAKQSTRRSGWSRVLAKLPGGFSAIVDNGVEYVWRFDDPFAGKETASPDPLKRKKKRRRSPRSKAKDDFSPVT